MLNELVQDVRYGIRGLLKAPGFAAVAILTLALGIGANSAIFSFVDGVLLKPLPYPDPEQILLLWEKPPGGGNNVVSAMNFLDWKSQSSSFTSVAATTGGPMTLTGRGEPTLMRVSRVSAGYFDILGMKPKLGRTFAPDEDQPGKEHVVVLSHRLWANEFGGDPALVGRTITLEWRGVHRHRRDARRFGVRSHVQSAVAAARLFAGRANAQLSLASSVRAVEAGRHHRAGASGDGQHRRPDRAGLSRLEQRLGRFDRPLHGLDRRPADAKLALRADERRRDAVADRLCQPRQPDAGTRHVARARGRGESLARRRPRTPDPAVSHREHRARCCRRRCRSRRGLRVHAAAHAAAAAVLAAGCRPCGAWIRACSVSHSCSRSRPASCSAWRPRSMRRNPISRAR